MDSPPGGPGLILRGEHHRQMRWDILNQAWELTKVRAQALDARRRMSSHRGGTTVRGADLNAGARPFHAVT